MCILLFGVDNEKINSSKIQKKIEERTKLLAAL